MKAFYIDENTKGKGYRIRITLEAAELICKSGPINTSFGILAPRLMGMEYHDYLAFVRQEYGAELKGSTSKYISYVIRDKVKSQELVNLLNDRWNFIINEVNV